MKHFITFLLGTILISTTLTAQATGSISGVIIDSENGEAVFGATIVVRSEKKFAKTDFDGKYSLALPPGSYDVEFQMYGYGPQRRNITVSAGKNQSVNVTFGAQTLETVEVKDRSLNNTESAMLALQRKSAGVSDGISQEAIKKSPDSNAGDVVRRVTGITLVGGKYVFVRGLGERYSNTVLNEVLIPSTEPDKRVVPLDIFPSTMIKNIRVLKTFVPEDPAEFSGGLVKIETQEYPDSFQMSAGLGIGRNMNTTGKEFKTLDAVDFLGRPNSDYKLPGIVNSLPSTMPLEPGNRFGGLPPDFVNLAATSFNQQWTPDTGKAGYDKNVNFSVGNTFKLTESGQRLGILFGVMKSEEYRFKDEKSGRYIRNNIGGVELKETTYLQSIQTQDSKIYNKDTNFATNLNLSYELTKGQQIYLKNLYTIASDTMVRDSFGQNFIDSFDFISQTGMVTSRGLFNTVLGGDHALQFGSMARPHKIEWNLAYALANRDEPNLTQQVWRRANPANFTEPYFKLGNNPDGTRFFSTSEDTVRQANLKYTIPFEQWNGLKSELKVGGMALDRFKSFSFREFGNKSNIGTQTADYWPVPGEIGYNPTQYIRNSTGVANKTFSERQIEQNAYDAEQKLHAQFAQVDMPLMPKLRFVGGVRFEDSFQKVKTFRTRDTASLSNVDYGCDIQNEDVRVALIRSNVCNQDNNGIGVLRNQDRLPSANMVWEMHKDMNLRFGYTQTLTRPDLRELSPFGFTPYFGADRIFGNPNLRRSYIHNYDVRYEYYITNTDYFGIGAFYKHMSNPIEMVGLPRAGGISFNFSYTNAKEATIEGVEFDYRKEFFDKFRVETNVFLIKSHVQVIPWENITFIRAGIVDRLNQTATYDPTNISRRLQGQSDYVFNLKFDYFLTSKKNQTLGVYYNFFGDRIYSVGTDGNPDAIEKGVGLTDIVYTFKHDDRLDFKAAAKNIFDTRFKVYQRSELTGEDLLFYSYRMGVTFTVAATYKFF
ncbi:TonB-dependent receptor [Leptospira sp. 2 VSF19]|uniref:TonB-dependent receptor n=1 Tax=Leptospira soteropolitanensis TaxID=2950025 RepID=A0AAW5VHJ3_9LEPT|nr:TonB-dependent receptor [Leptospira soteropolitanensis]MCW7491443.1 TonB-dependent receptor [Leptospira soteropolitanensis]MCW7499027.1 TonB-dependent receptor [Leptospira soteropolitanensis]MCW7521381.1 TonB-dependent receptor [Leptospira soteropolitanensis]MCW7525131.1 TonB-dependent receptor [Leptospira soteropolitanensis]MCW7528998.1 TonB-dependent receptor [Leptospira soteropolitanensis]